MFRVDRFAANIFDVVAFVSCRGPHPVCVFAPGWLSLHGLRMKRLCACVCACARPLLTS